MGPCCSLACPMAPKLEPQGPCTAGRRTCCSPRGTALGEHRAPSSRESKARTQKSPWAGTGPPGWGNLRGLTFLPVPGLSLGT